MKKLTITNNLFKNQNQALSNWDATLDWYEKAEGFYTLEVSFDAPINLLNKYSQDDIDSGFAKEDIFNRFVRQIQTLINIITSNRIARIGFAAFNDTIKAKIQRTIGLQLNYMQQEGYFDNKSDWQANINGVFNSNKSSKDVKKGWDLLSPEAARELRGTGIFTPFIIQPADIETFAVSKFSTYREGLSEDGQTVINPAFSVNNLFYNDLQTKAVLTIPGFTGSVESALQLLFLNKVNIIDFNLLIDEVNEIKTKTDKLSITELDDGLIVNDGFKLTANELKPHKTTNDFVQKGDVDIAKQNQNLKDNQQDTIITSNANQIKLLNERTKVISENVDITRAPAPPELSATWSYNLSTTIFNTKWIINNYYEFVLRDNDSLSVFIFKLTPDVITNITVPEGNACTALLSSETNTLVLTNLQGNFTAVDVRIIWITQLAELGGGVREVFESDVKLNNEYTIIATTQEELNLGQQIVNTQLQDKTQYFDTFGRTWEHLNNKIDLSRAKLELISGSLNLLLGEDDTEVWKDLIFDLNAIINMSGGQIKNTGNPTDDSDAANKKYVDDENDLQNINISANASNIDALELQTSNLDANGQVKNEPVSGTDIATKNYTDSKIEIINEGDPTPNPLILYLVRD